MSILTPFTQPIIDKLQKWNRDRKYKEDVYFKIVPNIYPRGLMTIELLQGPFKGILYSYGAINIDEDLGPKGARASFDIEIINRDELTEDYLSNEKFCRLAGEILLAIMERAVRVQADKFYRENLDEEVREDYIEEFVPQRTISKKNPSVPKKRVSPRKKRKNAVRGNKKVCTEVQSTSDSRSDSD